MNNHWLVRLSRRREHRNHLLPGRGRKEINRLIVFLMALLLLVSACTSAPSPATTSPPEPTAKPTTTPTVAPTSTNTPTPEPTATFTPEPTATPNLYQFNGYWLSPIGENTGAFIKTYGNTCREIRRDKASLCIQNWKGDKGVYPNDFMDIMVCPYHMFAWDFKWDHQGENVYAVQGGQVLGITLEDNSSNGVHFIIVDIRPDDWYGANYGHVDVNTLVDNQIITEDQREKILAREVLDGALVHEGQLLGVTGDDCCPFGVLHIGTSYGGFYNISPAELWELGEWPDYNDALDPTIRRPEDACGSLWNVIKMVEKYVK